MEYIVKDSKSAYKILIPKSADEKLIFAAKECRRFIRRASGASLGITVKPSGCYISISQNGAGGDGYSVKTEGKNIYVCGQSAHGAVYGTYALLKKLIGLEFYTPKAFELNKGDVPLPGMNFSVQPDIPVRASGIAPCHSEERGNGLLPGFLRMGLRGMAEGWGIMGHTYFLILPPEKYKDEHPEWYSSGDGGVNLCLSDQNMRREFTENLIEFIERHKDVEIFMIGQQDNNSRCTCEKCQRYIESAGGYYSALMAEFTTNVVKEINRHFEKTDPARKLRFVMFAYQLSTLPPVKREKGKFLSLLKEKLPHNLSVMLAPLAVRGEISYFDPENRISFDTRYISEKSVPLTDVIEGWRAVCDKLFFWAYDIDNVNNFIPFNSFDSIAENYRGYKNIGVEYLFEEGAYIRYVPNFNALRLYLVSVLMWNCNADTEATYDKFFNGYYGAAAVQMREYFEYLQQHLRKITRESGRYMFYIRFDDFKDLGDKQYWPKDVVEKAYNLFRMAYSAAKGKYKNRVREDGAPVFYLYLSLDYPLKDKEKAFMRTSLHRISEKYDLFTTGLEGVPAGMLRKLTEKRFSV